jgi:hypothetical protein
VFSVRSMLYKGNVGDYFLPELLVKYSVRNNVFINSVNNSLQACNFLYKGVTLSWRLSVQITSLCMRSYLHMECGKGRISDVDEPMWARGPTCCSGGLRKCEASTVRFCDCFCFEKLEGSASCMYELHNILQAVSALMNIQALAENS